MIHIHCYSAWKDRGVVDVFDNVFADKHPIRSVMVQEKRCKVCFKLKTRRVRV